MASRLESIRLIAVLGLASALLGIAPAYSGEKVLYAFKGGSDGAGSLDPVISD